MIKNKFEKSQLALQIKIGEVKSKSFSHKEQSSTWRWTTSFYGLTILVDCFYFLFVR